MGSGATKALWLPSGCGVWERGGVHSICADTQPRLGLSQLPRDPCTLGLPRAREQQARRAQGPPTRPEFLLFQSVRCTYTGPI